MSNGNSDNDSLLSFFDDLDLTVGNEDSQQLDCEAPEEQQLIEIIQLEEGELDPRLKTLSHSSCSLLRSCPRKYQLRKLGTNEVPLADKAQSDQSVTFAFGTAVGVGIQSVFEGKSLDRVVLDTFLAWDTDLWANNPRQNKSFPEAVFAVKRLFALREQGLLEDYELVYHEGKPAIELSFQVILPNGYRYRGFMDGVLRNKLTGEVVVMENKTTSGKALDAMYKNSPQALSYGVVLDYLFPGLSSYEVLYLVYLTGEKDYAELPFLKSLYLRATWLQQILLDVKVLELYTEFDEFPMNGNACYSFGRECEYFGTCTLSTENLVKPLTNKGLDALEADKDKYQIAVAYEDLLQSQLEKDI